MDVDPSKCQEQSMIKNTYSAPSGFQMINDKRSRDWRSTFKMSGRKHGLELYKASDGLSNSSVVQRITLSIGQVIL